MKPLLHKRWLRFSVRGLLVAIALIAIWLAWHMHGVNAQRRLVQRVNVLGGSVNYAYQVQRDQQGNYNTDPKAELSTPQWLVNLLGPDHFSNITIVSLRMTPATDDDLRLVGSVPTIENIDLTETKITGAGLRHLKPLRHLRVLGVWKTRVDDAGLRHLAQHHELWNLSLDETDVTDAGLVHLRNMNLEEWLGLAHTRVSDEGLAHLGHFKKLRSLNLIGTAVTKEGVKKLQTELPNTDISR